MTLSKRIVMNICALLFVVSAMIVDRFLVSEAEQVVVATCETRVSYNKSGSMICLDQPHKAVKVAQR